MRNTSELRSLWASRRQSFTEGKLGVLAQEQQKHPNSQLCRLPCCEDWNVASSITDLSDYKLHVGGLSGPCTPTSKTKAHSVCEALTCTVPFQYLYRQQPGQKESEVLSGASGHWLMTMASAALGLVSQLLSSQYKHGDLNDTRANTAG